MPYLVRTHGLTRIFFNGDEMSRIGKKPINLPKGVDVKVQGSSVTVKGPKGQLQQDFSPDIKISVKDGNVIVDRSSDEKQFMALHGVTRSVISNMVTGVNEGYEKVLEIQGVGYKAQAKGKKLVLTLGYSHPVEFLLREGVTAETDSKQTRITLKGIDKQLIGQVAADIRFFRPPDLYKGKGIRYAGEMVKLKAGKAGKK